ncbi:MAG: chitobiase/beta-hexosaminidase C-terminal domain-containing protein [Spirochaetes bacterium]|nr:chitobiase/beta-hexosaminidase C-terminal domain-containing protein [Spirochaetota bacterium]
MKKLLLFLFSLPFYISIYPQTQIKAVVYSFDNQTDEKKYSYFSEILPQSVSKELTRLNYSTERETASIPPESGTSAEYADKLKKISEEKNADYVITGSFAVSGKNLTAKSHIFIRRTGRIFEFSSEQETGPYISKIVNEISEKTAYYIDRYIPRMTEEPDYDPKSRKFVKKGFVKLNAKKDDSVIYYTTDGSVPDPEKNKNTKKYSEPIPIEKKTTIKAFAVREGWNPSSVASEQYSLTNQYSKLHIIFSAGIPLFTGVWGKDLSRNDSRTFSVKFDLGLKENLFLRFAYNTIAAKPDDSTLGIKYNLYGGSLGFAYQFKLGEYLRLKPHAGAGWFYGYMSPEDGFTKSIFIKSKNAGDSTDGFYGELSASAGIALGHIEFGVIAGFSFYQLEHDEDMKVHSYSFYTALRF